MKKYVCEPCGYEYDPAVGDPDNGIEPGTAFEDIPEDWVCPVCGMGKEVFVPRQPLFMRSPVQKKYAAKAVHGARGE